MTAEKLEPESYSPAPLFPDLFLDDVFTLETPRLFLRWPKAADIPALVVQAGDARVSRDHAVLPHPYKREDGEQFVAFARGVNAEGNNLHLAIAKRGAPEKLIGCVGLRTRANGEVSIGYWLGVEHWGQGFATEATQAILDAVFLYTELESVIAEVRVTNEASRRVLARCGFQYEGSGMCARPAFNDVVAADCYRLTRSLWASLKGWRAPLPHGRLMVVE
ncbi:MAG: GNAT family N-acetyltransferase [Proteobacteria bacterium]|nr:GNAT family N-acetyltransferase [Pseudomonadota bacterium]